MATARTPSRGEVWLVNFDPATGSETAKVRPAVVVSRPGVGRLPLRIVVPVTDWKPWYDGYPWFIRLTPDPSNGLTKDSGADAFQVKSASLDRFIRRLGVVTTAQLDAIAYAIGLSVGVRLPDRR